MDRITKRHTTPDQAWQPISTVPTDETVLIHWAESEGWDGAMGIGVLCTDEDDDQCPMWYAATDTEGDMTFPYCGIDPTHWQPMPPR